MAGGRENEIEQIVLAVLAARDYAGLDADLVRRAAGQAMATGARGPAAVKLAKRRLHQAVGAFSRPIDLGRDTRRLREAAAAGPAELRAALRDVLRLHASTRERLPILGDFYRRVFEFTGAPRRVLDLGCGLGPVALPWMGLGPETEYLACDADGDVVEIVSLTFGLLSQPGRAWRCDVTTAPPTEEADVALVLKLLPTLDQQAPGRGVALLAAVRARFVVVSYPVRSLGGRHKGMVGTYSQQLARLIAGQPWLVHPVELSSELAFVIDKG